jgi:integrase
VFSLAECRRLLVAARRYRQGKFLRYVVLQLFGGLRPGEALRASRINLKDGEIDLAGKETKTWHPRLVKMDPLLVSWIEVATGPAVNPQNSRLHWDELRRKAKLTRWPDDVLRHTAISHHFRRGGSYGLTAEWAGNSEAIIKRHYQGRVTSDESAVFWGWFPDRQVRAGARKVVSQKRPRTSRAETTSLR